MDNSVLNLLRDAIDNSEKTAAMWLQEICVKSGISPRFSDVKLSTVDHDPKFQITAKVEGFNGITYEANGIASNKKVGKQVASLNMLYKMGITPTDLINVKSVTAKDKEIDRSSYGDSSNTLQNGDNLEQPTQVVVPTPSQSEEISITVVMDLSDLCARKGLPVPEFNEDFEARGPPHNRIFTCECTVKMVNGEEALVAKTEAPTKKLAKRKSAHLMIKKIRDEGISATSIFSGLGLGGVNEATGTATRTCDNRLKCSELVAHQHHQFLTFQGTVIKSLHEENNLVEFQGDMDYVKILNDASEQEIFNIVFEVLNLDGTPIKNKEDKFLYRCEMDFGFKIQMNPSVCIATGTSEEEAKNRAAYESLLFLRNVTVVV